MQPSDFQDYWQLVKEPSIARAAHFEPATKQTQAQWLFSDDLHHAVSFAVILADEMIGMIAMYETIGTQLEPNVECLELGYMILPDQQGHGYMTQALKMLITRLRKKAKVKKLVALVDENNVASQRVLTQNQFVNYQSVLDMSTGHENLVFQRKL